MDAALFAAMIMAIKTNVRFFLQFAGKRDIVETYLNVCGGNVSYVSAGCLKGLQSRKVRGEFMTAEEISKGENDNIEYKADIPPKSENYMRTVVAYANANGGRLVFGVENNTWKVSGFSRDEVYQKMDAVTNAIYDSCEPKITPGIEIQEADGKYIIVADIPAGMQRPYCVKSQGMIEGVYLRVSGTTRKAAVYQIQEMTLAARNRSFDSEKVQRILSADEMNRFCSRLYQHAKELCVNQEAQNALRQIGISQLISFKAVCEENGIYYATNGYQLLDGQLDEYPDAAVQCAVFKGTTRNIFITRKEFYGCIDEQIESAYAFVLEHIDLGARIDGLVRQDIYELPIHTIREMITNAVCHRSYLCPGKVQVALFDDRLEVTSPGMLDKDLTVEKMKAGISKIRNGVLAKIFMYMNMVEAWGTGIPKIFEEAKHYGLREPELLDMGSDFRINLYRRKPVTDAYGVIAPQLTGVRENRCYAIKSEKRAAFVSSTELSNEEKLLLLIRANESVTQIQMSDYTGLSLRTIKRMTVKLQKEEKIVRIGNSRFGKWKVIDENSRRS